MLCPAKICRSLWHFCGQMRVSRQTNVTALVTGKMRFAIQWRRQVALLHSVQLWGRGQIAPDFCWSLHFGLVYYLAPCLFMVRIIEFLLTDLPSLVIHYVAPRALRMAALCIQGVRHARLQRGDTNWQSVSAGSGRTSVCCRRVNSKTNHCFAWSHSPVIRRNDSRIFGYFTILYQLLFYMHRYWIISLLQLRFYTVEWKLTSSIWDYERKSYRRTFEIAVSTFILRDWGKSRTLLSEQQEFRQSFEVCTPE